MDSTIVIVTVLAVTAASGIGGYLIVRAITTVPQGLVPPDNTEWQRVQEQRVGSYVAFTEPAFQIGATAGMWPALSPRRRRHGQKTVFAHLQTLKRLQTSMVLDDNPTVTAAAQQLVEDCERIARSLDLDAPSGPVLTVQMELTEPFLAACREAWEDESLSHFGLRPTGRSLFARLSTR
ncbi:hypothetical protein [Streptomyces sp. S1D4-20]|uniref:hypothetical protein n=1 Tax=Streptomyces sp. S1D4-20 TaxID=2594462 RepID=UPI001162862A|nr:hypothetical protein [Streptomyces sp. S1D4-20]QDN54103.1 hypothetical protein FNV67_00545 [Streptomyces sp. S1D4-20]